MLSLALSSRIFPAFLTTFGKLPTEIFTGPQRSAELAIAGRFSVFRRDCNPSWKPIPAAGEAGVGVIILGNGFTGTSGVSFDGTAAAFTVISDTEITATVPVGASTGTVKVTTTDSVLDSNVAFRVRP